LPLHKLERYTREGERERIDPNDVCTCWLHLCYCLRRLGVPFIAPNGLGAVRASFGSSQPSLVAGAPDCPVAHRTVNSNGSDWQFPSPEQLAVGAPDRLLFTVLCTGQVTIHCPVHRTQLLFTVLCTGHSYYSLSCAPDMSLFTVLCTGQLLFTVLCTSQQHIKCFFLRSFSV
jgi:hypothetical protein